HSPVSLLHTQRYDTAMIAEAKIFDKRKTDLCFSALQIQRAMVCLSRPYALALSFFILSLHKNQGAHVTIPS
ncbi:MAG TPA: hypothetical protein VF905_13870, partial [Nitrospirota bacterium]